MNKMTYKKAFQKMTYLITVLISSLSLHASIKETTEGSFQPMVVPKFLEEVKKNTNWKTAFATGEQEQIVFMNISPKTNPNNEIGMEVHSFDQVIIIVEGKGKAVLNGKSTSVEKDSMIFIPKGTKHNVINLDRNKELKLVSFYSQTDILKGAVYKTKVDEAE